MGDPASPQHPGLARCESGEATSVNVQEGLRRRRAENGEVLLENLEVEERRRKEEHWRRILLLIVAVTVHNIPEGLAVGVGRAASWGAVVGFIVMMSLDVALG